MTGPRSHANSGRLRSCTEGLIPPRRSTRSPWRPRSGRSMSSIGRPNLGYSPLGYSNPWSLREALGNAQSDWLDATLPLARGQLVAGWRLMNWVPGKGGCHCAPPASSLGLAPAPHVATDGTTYYAWTPDRRQAVAPPPPPPQGLGLAPRVPPSMQEDPEATRTA